MSETGSNGNVGWDDVWIPECLQLFLGEPPIPHHSPEILLADRLEQETPNHRRLRFAVAYGRLPDEGGRQQAVDSLQGELTSDGLTFDEWNSTTYSPFYGQGTGVLTVLAAERGDGKLLDLCRRWWAAWTGLSAAVSVPIPRNAQGQPQIPGNGSPEGDLLQYGEVLGPGFRCNRDRNRDNGILLRMLCGLATSWDRSVIQKVQDDLNPDSNRNLLQLAYVERLLSDRVLKPVEYDPPVLAGQVPVLRSTLFVERWETGYRAWFDEGKGRGPVHLGILVNERRTEYLDREDSKQMKVWKREKDVPPPPVEPEDRFRVPRDL